MGFIKAFFFFFLVYMPEQTQRFFFFPLEKLGLVLLYLSHFFIIKSWAHWHCSSETIKEGCQQHSLLFQKILKCTSELRFPPPPILLNPMRCIYSRNVVEDAIHIITHGIHGVCERKLLFELSKDTFTYFQITN